MGKRDVITNEYMSNPEYFADALNYYLYDGNDVIRPNKLRDLDSKENIVISSYDEGKNAVEKVRDVIKLYCAKEDDDATYVIFGVENQSEQHLAMPVRDMLYDAINYSNQIKQISRLHRKNKDLSNSSEFLSGLCIEDKIKPVITVVIYWKDDSWEAPRKLSDMFEVSARGLQEYINDYKLNIIVPKEIDDFTKFRTEVGDVLEFIRIQNENDGITRMQTRKGADWCMSKEAVEIINEFTDAKIPTDTETVGGKVKMCRATAALIEQGVDKSMKLMKILYELGRDEDAKKASYDPEYREKLMEEFEEELK